jgi:hypothetical protein
MYPRIIGRFNLASGRLFVTDPCYRRASGCSGLVENAAPGEWTGIVTVKAGDGHLFNATLEARHESHPLKDEAPTGAWEAAGFEVGVDSGQAGIFDEALYPPGDTGQWDGSGSFFDRACGATLGAYDGSDFKRDCPAGAITEGVVSISGHGDGGYRCMIYRRPDGVCTAVRIIFIEGGGVA